MKEPEILLPWDDIEMSHVWQEGKPIHSSSGDSEYATHACNAYPKLVNFLKLCKPGNETDSFVREKLLEELGEAGVAWESAK